MNSFLIRDNQDFSTRDIVTLGCEDHLQRRNTLKGLAMQKLVHLAMKESKEDTTIKKIFESLLEKQTEYFIVEKPFRSHNKYFLRKWSFIHSSDLTDICEIWIREESISKEWKVCNYCGLKIKAAKQFSRKCKRCNIGWFHFVEDKKIRWKPKWEGEKATVLKLLLLEGYIKKVHLRKRLDFFHYTDGVFSIYESKNKELSGLNFKDLSRTLIYPFIIQRSGFPVNELNLIFNGKITKELKKKINAGFGQEFSFEIKLWPVRKFLQANNIHVKKIIVRKSTDGYLYDIIFGDTAKIIIDLRALDSFI
jgi:hypothetical protein